MNRTTPPRMLDIGRTFHDAFKIGFRNAPSIIGCILLWIITIWIPYINIGTTIAVSLLPLELAKGNTISPLSIFDSRYRKYMGEYMITSFLKVIPLFVIISYGIYMAIQGVQVYSATSSFTEWAGDFGLSTINSQTVTAGLGVFFVFLSGLIPTIVLCIAWSLAYYFLFDREMNPIEAIKASNDATYGSKWMIFFVTLLLIILIVIGIILTLILCSFINSTTVNIILILLAFAFLSSFAYACSASIWNQLKDNVGPEAEPTDPEEAV